MRKISIEKAKELINAGIPVKARISRDEISVATLNELDNLKHLREENVQNFELFYEPVSIPNDALDATLDDAINLLNDGETIYSKHDGKEISFSSKSDINHLLEYYRSCMVHDKCCNLYWCG